MEAKKNLIRDRSTVEKAAMELVSRMSLEQKAGQVLTLCFNGTTLYPLVYEQVQKLHCGGLRLTQSVVGETRDGWRRAAPYASPGQYAEVLNQLQDLALAREHSIPLHFVGDQEGDRSSNYCMGGVRFMPSQVGLTACGSPDSAYRAARAMARQQRAVGIHWVNSPVLDVNSNWRNPEIGWRAFSDRAEVCKDYGAAFLQGLREEGVIGSAKHFPGRGDSDQDAHHAVTSIDVSKKLLMEREILPYTGGRQWLSSIMLAHTAFPALDSSGRPATLSSAIITDFLRGELGFDGVVTTDNMEMEGISQLHPIPEACWRALAAGADVVLMKAENNLCRQVHSAIIEAVRRGDLPESRLDEANRRLLSMKMEYGIFDKPKAEPKEAAKAVFEPEVVSTARDLAYEGANYARFNSELLPLPQGARIILIEQFCDSLTGMQADDLYVHNGMLLEKLMAYSGNILHLPISWHPSEDEIRRTMERFEPGFDLVAVTDWAARSQENNAELIRAVKGHGLPVVSLTNTPYPPWVDNQADAVLMTFQTRDEGLAAAADILFGHYQPRGRWPLGAVPARGRVCDRASGRA